MTESAVDKWKDALARSRYTAATKRKKTEIIKTFVKWFKGTTRMHPDDVAVFTDAVDDAVSSYRTLAKEARHLRKDLSTAEVGLETSITSNGLFHILMYAAYVGTSTYCGRIGAIRCHFGSRAACHTVDRKETQDRQRREDIGVGYIPRLHDDCYLLGRQAKEAPRGQSHVAG